MNNNSVKVSEGRDMGDQISISLEVRTLHGKKVAQLRKQSIVPGVIYGPGFDPISVQAVQQVIDKTYRSAGKHHPVYVSVAGKKKIAMIKDIDIDPVKNIVRHISFHAVNQNETVEAEIPVHLIGEGESAAEKAGLIVLQTIDKLNVKALPMDLPDALEVSIIDMAQPGDRVTVADITIPKNVELVDHAAEQSSGDDEESHSITELVVASVYEPSALAAANDAAGGDAVEEADVESEHGEDTVQDSQAEESRPGGKGQDEPKQSNLDANK